MTVDVLAQARELLALERDAIRRDDQHKTGARTSDENDLRDQESRAILEKSQSPEREAIQWLTIHLRDFFSHHELTWVGDPRSGNTDVETSRIIIDSSLGMNLKDNMSKPRLYVDAAPSGGQDPGVGNIRAWNISTSDRTYTGLDMVTLATVCRAETRAYALDLSAFLRRYLRAHKEELCRQRWVDFTTPIAQDMGPVGDPNSPLAHQVRVVVQVTVQWTIRTRRQDGIGETANGAAVGIEHLGDSEEDLVPHFVDGRPQTGLQVLDEHDLLVLDEDP